MNRVKMPAYPCLIICVARCRAVYFRNRVSDFAINAFPFPNAILDRVTIRSAVRGTDADDLVELFSQYLP